MAGGADSRLIERLKPNLADRGGRVDGRHAERPRVGRDARLYRGPADDREVGVHARAVPQRARALAEELGDRASEPRHSSRSAHQHHAVHVACSYQIKRGNDAL